MRSAEGSQVATASAAGTLEPGPIRLPGHHDRQPARHGDDPRRTAGVLDPLARAFARSQLHIASAPPPPAAAPPNATLVYLDQMMTKLVRKVAWGGDGARGAARIELGAGELAGATIVVRSDSGALSIDVDLPPGVAADAWRERLEQRFKRRGLDLVELNVR